VRAGGSSACVHEGPPPRRSRYRSARECAPLARTDLALESPASLKIQSFADSIREMGNSQSRRELPMISLLRWRLPFG
jgi:hypothetical protein